MLNSSNLVLPLFEILDVEKALGNWKNKPAADKIWANFKTNFKES